MNMQAKANVGREAPQASVDGSLISLGADQLDYVLKLRSGMGTVCAIEYLKACDIGYDQIVQVLALPNERKLPCS